MSQAKISRCSCQQISVEEVIEKYGTFALAPSIYVARTLHEYLGESKNFTGKIVFTVNCRNGGVGNTEAFVQRKL